MPNRYPKAPPQWIQDRLASCRSSLAGRDLSAVIVTQPDDIYYLTGFTGEDSAIVITRRDVHVVSDGRFDHSADEEIPWAKKHLRKGALVDEVATVARKLRIKNIGVQADDMTVSDFESLRRLVRPIRLAKAKSVVNAVRRTKDRREIQFIKRAIEVAQDAFKATRKTIRIGQTEQEMAARLEYEMRKRGSEKAAFSTICAIGPNAAHPHAKPGRRRVRSGSLILFDWGATVDKYRSDLTRCVFVRKIPPTIGDVYKVVLDAQLAAIDAIRPGIRMCDVDGVAREYIAKAGYGDQFVHGLGHGIGLAVHEPPSLSWRSREPLEAGNVVTVEPGIYLPGIGGIRIEDDVLVTSKGHQVLSNLEKNLSRAII